MKHQIVLLSFVFIFLFSVSISAYETDKIDLKGSFNRANARENFYSEKYSVFFEFNYENIDENSDFYDKWGRTFIKGKHLKLSSASPYGYLAEADKSITYLRSADVGLFTSDVYNSNINNFSALFAPYVFSDCTNLKYVYLTERQDHIMHNAFENCTSLTSVRINQHEDNLHSGVAYNYSPTTQSIYISWEGGLYSYCDTTQKLYNYYNSFIEPEAFVNCPNLTSVIIDGMDTVIEDNAFVNCGDITIYCPQGSKAEEFAKRNGYKYQNITTERFYSAYIDNSVYPHHCYEERTEILNEMTELEKKIFDEELYLLYNPDLVDSPFDSEELLYAHWLANGLQSGGSHVFDAEYYLNANPDLKKAFGDDKEAAYRHFLSNGYKELRDSSPEYCGKAYKNRYKDLADMTSEQLITHYLSYGINEGRNAAAEHSLIYGDVNCDGALTSADSTYIMQKVLNADFKMPIELYTNEYKKYADVDGDNMLTANDAVCVMQKVLNKSYKMPIE